MTYSIKYANAVKKQLRKLPKKIQERIVRKIELLEKNPRPIGSIALEGRKDKRRIKVGREYRILYTVKNVEVTILILKVGHRQNFYRGV